MSTYINIPTYNWKNPVDAVVDLPTTSNQIGDARVVVSEYAVYVWTGSAWQTSAGGGGGAVDSVNGQTGVVVLDAQDVEAVALGGNTTGADVSLGTNDGQAVIVKTNNTTRLTIGAEGAFTFVAGDDVGGIPNNVSLTAGNGTTGGIGANVNIKAGNSDTTSGNINLEVSDQSSFFGGDGKIRFLSASTEIGYFDSNGLWINNPTTNGLRLLNAAGTFSQGFRGDPDNVIASNLLWGLPPTIGTAGQVLARTGVSDTEWVTMSGAGDMTKAVYDTNNQNTDIFNYATAMAIALG